MTTDIVNYFHDWVSTEFRFNDHFVVGLSIMDTDGITHFANITFMDYQDLEFSYWTYINDQRELLQHTERKNTELMKEAGIDRWLQRIEKKGGVTELQLIGGNDFIDSFLVLFTFKHKSIRIVVDDKEFKNEESLSRYLSDQRIF